MTIEHGAGTAPGALALVGSGEYTAAMSATDGYLLGTLPGPARPRVAVIPTASALEPGQPQRWNAMGVAHFSGLGADVTAFMLLDRHDAADAALAASLAEHDLFYFSGGSPEHLAETLDGTPAWAAIAARAGVGAAVAGCSAGAMMLGAAFLRIRELRSGGPPRWRPGLGLAAGLAVLPHFDRIRHALPDNLLRLAVAAAPPGVTVVGIDEDTALVRPPGATAGATRWQVMGRQMVTVFGRDGQAALHPAGAEIALA